MRYNGDDDGFARSKDKHRRDLFEDGEWRQIADLLQRLALVHAGLAANSFKVESHRMLAELTDNAETAKKLQEIAQEM